MAGRPLKFETPEALQQAVDDYFASTDQITLAGLALHIGIDRQTLYNYKERDEFSSVINYIYKKTGGRQTKRNLGITFKNASQYSKDRYRNDPNTAIRIRINALMRYHLKEHTSGYFRHLPYTVPDLRKHLEKKFKPGMGWHNMDKWHIDHVVPVSLFNFDSVKDEEFLQAYSLYNLQPLWAYDNLVKGCKLTDAQISIGL